MAIRPFPKKVRVPSQTVVFPQICPHCLDTASERIPIESKGVLTGFYVFYTKWKYSAIPGSVLCKVRSKILAF
jgi:hypothetical protein